jgi:hypothetical protein
LFHSSLLLHVDRDSENSQSMDRLPYCSAIVYPKW